MLSEIDGIQSRSAVHFMGNKQHILFKPHITLITGILQCYIIIRASWANLAENCIVFQQRESMLCKIYQN